MLIMQDLKKRVKTANELVKKSLKFKSGANLR